MSIERAVLLLEQRMTRLSGEAETGGLFDRDRSKLASELDAARARERELADAGEQAPDIRCIGPHRHDGRPISQHQTQRPDLLLYGLEIEVFDDPDDRHALSLAPVNPLPYGVRHPHLPGHGLVNDDCLRIGWQKRRKVSPFGELYPHDL